MGITISKSVVLSTFVLFISIVNVLYYSKSFNITFILTLCASAFTTAMFEIVLVPLSIHHYNSIISTVAIKF